MEQNGLWQSGVWNTRNFSIFKTPSKQRMIFVIGGGLEKKLSLYDRREILWAQKVRSDWVIFGDRNT